MSRSRRRKGKLEFKELPPNRYYKERLLVTVRRGRPLPSRTSYFLLGFNRDANGEPSPPICFRASDSKGDPRRTTDPYAQSIWPEIAFEVLSRIGVKKRHSRLSVPAPGGGSDLVDAAFGVGVGQKEG